MRKITRTRDEASDQYYRCLGVPPSVLPVRGILWKIEWAFENGAFYVLLTVKARLIFLPIFRMRIDVPTAKPILSRRYALV